MPKPKPSQVAIDTVYAELDNPTPLNKTFAILETIRSGTYYNSSNKRAHLLNEYGRLVAELSDNDYAELKSYLGMPQIIRLFEDRENRKIAYATLSKLIEYSSKRDLAVYNRYECLVKDLNDTGKMKFSEYLFTLFDVKWALDQDIDALEDYYFEVFCRPHPYWCDVHKLSRLTFRVKEVDRRKMLQRLFNVRPFSNDTNAIDFFVRCHPELKRYLILM